MMDRNKIARSLIQAAKEIVAGDVVEFVTKVPIDFDRRSLPEGYEDTPELVEKELKDANIGGRVVRVKIHDNKPWQVWSEVRVDADDELALEKAIYKTESGILSALEGLTRKSDWYDEYIYRNWNERKFNTEVM